MGEYPPVTLRTSPFAHYGVAWSPFHPYLFALASSANYGLIGNGRLHIARISSGVPPGPGVRPLPNTEIRLEKAFNTQDGLYDLAWSEIHENQIVTASGDGSLKLWDIMLNDLPIRAWHEHAREAFSVDFSNIRKEVFASSSWDGQVKVWTPELPASIQTIAAHGSCIYQALFSPHTPDTIATCSTDGTIKIFDLRQAMPTPPPSNLGGAAQRTSPAALVVPAHPTEILSIDWNKYRPWIIASGSVDRTVKVWDCRNVKSGGMGSNMATEVGGLCEITLPGHEYAVRKVQWSPHRADIIASASYDMTCRVWSTMPSAHQPALRAIHDQHTEFVAGCAWSLYDEGMLASCSWDHSVHLFKPLILP